MSRERPIAPQEAAVKAVAAEGCTCEEIEEIVRGTAELEGKRTERGPVEGRKGNRKGHIGDRRQRREGDEKSKRTVADASGEAT